MSDEPLAPWYAGQQGRIELDPAAPAESLSLARNLFGWIVRGEEELWSRIEPAVAAAIATPTAPLLVPIRTPLREDAARYHAAAAPLSELAPAARKPEAEALLYKKAVLLSPTDPDLYNHLSVAASLGKDYKTAARYAMLAIAIDPNFLSSYQELAYAYKNLERYEDSIRIAARGLNVDGDLHTKALLLARQGQSYWMLAKEEEALQAFRSSKRIGGPSWVDSYLEGKQTIGKAYKE